MSSLKEIVRKTFEHLGYDITKRLYGGLGRDAYIDMQRFVQTRAPIICDVGANAGQSLQRFKKTFPDARIYAFEPGAKFSELQQKAAQVNHVKTFNVAVGSAPGRLQLRETGLSEWSSFLPLNEKYEVAEVVRQTEVEIVTLDDFAATHQLDKIDILKSDTQGFELEVLKGASGLLDANRIDLVYLEITFEQFYADLPSFTQLFDFLTSRRFRIVSMYEPHYRDDLLAWADFLFARARST